MLNAQDQEDLREIIELEKIAKIRKSQGIKNGKDDDEDFMIDEEKRSEENKKWYHGI